MAALLIIAVIRLDNMQVGALFQGVGDRFTGGHLKGFGRDGLCENNAPAFGNIAANCGRNRSDIHGFTLGEQTDGRPAQIG